MSKIKQDNSSSFSPVVLVLIVLVLLCIGAGAYLYLLKKEDEQTTQYDYKPAQIKFKDELVSNAQPIQEFTKLMLTKASGEEILLKDFIGKSNLVFVVLRGYSNAICPYCSAQTQRIINRYDEIKQLESNVIIAYPLNGNGDRDKLDLFLNAANDEAKFKNDELPLTLGVDVELKVVDKLGIRADLSKPATYIVDKSGKLRFAYVGDTMSDRPSVDAILDQLKQINGS